jgi:Protein of unknown function (DUF3237)
MNLEGIFSPYGMNAERRILEDPNKWRLNSPNLQLLTVSSLPRPKGDFWSSLANARQPILRNGGTFNGPFLNGVVLQATVSGRYSPYNHTIEVLAKVEMVTEDGALIYKIDRGTWRGSNRAIERLINGESVVASEYYFVGLLKYSTFDSRYRWLEEGEYLSHGGIIGDELRISQFRVVSELSLAEWKAHLDTHREGIRKGSF